MKKNNFMGKKLLSFLLVISLISCALSYSLVVSAADLGTGETTGATNIAYTVAKTYSVTIPANPVEKNIAAGDTAAEGTLTGSGELKVNSGARIDSNEKLNVSIEGEGTDKAFVFKNANGQEFAAEVKVADNEFTTENNAIEAKAGSKTNFGNAAGEYAYDGVTKTIAVANAEPITMSGAFTCKLAFKVDLVLQ